jgi:hypothetical protein
MDHFESNSHRIADTESTGSNDDMRQSEVDRSEQLERHLEEAIDLATD